MRPTRALLACVLVLLPGCLASDPAPDPAGEAPPVTFEAMRVETALGTFTALLFPDEHPATTAFMRKLAEEDYYVKREFGRVIPGFVIQEVDRTGGTTDQKETIPLEAGTSVMFSAGAIGIARDVDPNSGGSEFFVMDFAVSPLYGNYTAFAQVVEGMDVVHAIARVPAVKTGPAGLVSSGLVPDPPGSPAYFGVHDRVPVEPVKMTKVSIVNLTLPAGEAARYPLRVGESTVTPELRATLEWPANLDAGNASLLTWYVAGRDPDVARRQVRDPPQPDLSGVRVVVEGPAGATLTPVEDAKVLGKLTFTWTPGARGQYALRLEKEGQPLAWSNVTVPSPPPFR